MGFDLPSSGLDPFPLCPSSLTFESGNGERRKGKKKKKISKGILVICKIKGFESEVGGRDEMFAD